MTTTTFALVSVFAAAVGASGAPADKAVALLPTSFEGELEDHWRLEIEKRIGDGFSQGDFRLVTGDALGSQAASCRAGECLTEIASSTGSDLLVVSSVSVVEKDYKISMEVIDGKDGATVATVEDTCGLCGAQEAAEMATDLASTLRSKVDSLAKAKPALIVTSQPPGATVRIDGQQVGQTPAQLELDPGEHVVVFERNGYVTEERTLTAVAGVRDRLSVEMTPTKNDWRRGAWVGGWAAFGVGVAGIAAGSTLLALHDRPYRTDCEADADGDCRNLYDTQTGGIVGLSVGGAALVTGIVLVVVSRKGRRKSTSNRAHLVPSWGGLAARF